MSKFKDIFAMASAVARPFVPSVGGSILDEVNKTLQHSQPDYGAAITALAKENEEQTKAIQALGVYAKSLEARIIALEGN